MLKTFGMESNHKLTLYVSYYLSRFNELALEKLNFNTWNVAFKDISKKPSVNHHSVKNWRDEFDPFHGHTMSPSRVKMAKALEGLNEETIRENVVDILSGNTLKDPENLDSLTNIVPDENISEL